MPFRFFFRKEPFLRKIFHCELYNMYFDIILRKWYFSYLVPLTYYYFIFQYFNHFRRFHHLCRIQYLIIYHKEIFAIIQRVNFNKTRRIRHIMLIELICNVFWICTIYRYASQLFLKKVIFPNARLIYISYYFYIFVYMNIDY